LHVSHINHDFRSWRPAEFHLTDATGTHRSAKLLIGMEDAAHAQIRNPKIFRPARAPRHFIKIVAMAFRRCSAELPDTTSGLRPVEHQTVRLGVFRGLRSSNAY
jgi:hypothetical protein